MPLPPRLALPFAQKEAPVRNRRHARIDELRNPAYGGRFVLFCAGEAGTRINGLTVSHPADCETRRFEDLA